ncbi:MFS transporter [Altererythrobacter aquiaggeris]|uniref:MFS transporter n=1 Tax=Aestuarierythrobacter aquiaggeris TaxID=1898396 RepID=UPI0030193B34
MTATPAKILALLCLGQFLAYFDRMSFAALAPAIQNDLGLGDATLGFLLGPAFGLTYGAAAVLLARFADGRSRLRLALAGLAGWTLGAILGGLADSAVELGATRMLMAAGQAAYVPASLAMLLDEAPRAKRAVYLSFFTSSASLGRSTALLGSGLVLTAIALLPIAASFADWRIFFLLTAIPNLAVLALLARAGPASALPAPKRRRIPEWLRRGGRALALYAALSILPIVALQSFAAWLPVLVVREFGLTSAQAAIWLGLVTLATAPTGQLLGGWLFRRFEWCTRNLPLVLASGLTLALIPGAILVGSSQLVVTLASLGILNMVFGVVSFASIHGVQEMTPSAQRGGVNAVFLAFVTVCGLGTGPALVGVFSMAGGDLGLALLGMLAACAGIACALSVPMGRHYRRVAWMAQREARIAR